MSRSYDYESLLEENKRLRADLADRIEHARLILWAEVLLFLLGVIVGWGMGRGYIL